MSIWSINKTYRNLQRFQTILNVLLKNGFGYLIRDLGLHRFLSIGKQATILRSDDEVSPNATTLPHRFRVVLEELGPTFIKFGQVLSARPDLIPEAFISELKKLREEVSPLPFAMIKKQVEVELRQDAYNIFSTIGETPIGAASIAQVHKAKLLTGEEVILKVQRPGIELIIKNDLSILLSLAKLIEKHIPESMQFDPIGLVHEFERTILKELDFGIEAANTFRFYENFQDDPDISIPRVYWDYSSKRIIVLERLHGINLDKRKQIIEAGLNPSAIARKCMRIFLKEVIEFGLFHADPHPGNVFVQPDGKIALVDFGMVGRLDHDAIRHLAMLIIALLERDYENLIQALKELGFVFDDDYSAKIRAELRDLIETYYGMPVQRINFSDLIFRVMETVVKFGIKAPAEFLTLSRALMIAEGIARQLDPSLDIAAIGRPIIQEILTSKADPQKWRRESVKVFHDFRRVVTILPSQINAVATKLIKGKLRFEFSHSNLDPLFYEIERLGNRIAFGLVIASIVLGSSIIMISSKGPLIFGYPALGVIGLLMAAIAGAWLLVSIIRSGRM